MSDNKNYTEMKKRCDFVCIKSQMVATFIGVLLELPEDDKFKSETYNLDFLGFITDSTIQEIVLIKETNSSDGRINAVKRLFK